MLSLREGQLHGRMRPELPMFKMLPFGFCRTDRV